MVLFERKHHHGLSTIGAKPEANIGLWLINRGSLISGSGPTTPRLKYKIKDNTRSIAGGGGGINLFEARHKGDARKCDAVLSA